MLDGSSRIYSGPRFPDHTLYIQSIRTYDNAYKIKINKIKIKNKKLK